LAASAQAISNLRFRVFAAGLALRFTPYKQTSLAKTEYFPVRREILPKTGLKILIARR